MHVPPVAHDVAKYFMITTPDPPFASRPPPPLLANGLTTAVPL